MSPTLLVVASVVGAALIFWAKEKEASLPQCDTCGPMYFGEHHPDCPERGA